MTKFLTGILGVIAAGVLLIAYGLLGPRASAFTPASETGAYGRAIPASYGYVPQEAPAGFVPVYVPGYVAAPSGYAPYGGAPVAHPASLIETTGTSEPMIQTAPTRVTRASVVAPAPQRVATRTVVERAPRRNWKKTALVIGGSTATGAGVGGLIGGKKGALIGAAIGGGASTLWESTR
jgi:hypothetical protein